jgi:outer membrane protein TolC
LYRNGIAINPTYQTIRITDNSTTKEGTNFSQLMFQVMVPLMRGRGRAVVAAQETAADIEVNATLLDLNQTISSLFSGTATAYWNALAAERALEVARASEERGGVYVDTVQTLINADRLARTEINQATANLSGRMANRVSAEQTLIEAQQQLALAMGSTADQMSSAGNPSEDFPPVGAETLPVVDSTLMEKYVQKALQRRADYLASQRRVREADVLLGAARNQLKPLVTLNLDTGVSGLSEGTGLAQFFSSPYHSIKGLDALAGITYNFPPRNDLATGQLRQAQAALTQAEIRRDDLGRNIASAVVTALNGVHNAIVQVLKSRESVKAFQAALDGEQEKFRLGVNSLTDVLTLEDRLTIAMQSQVNAELAYALALTQLRLATGTIVEPDQAVQSVDRNVFFSMP